MSWKLTKSIGLLAAASFLLAGCQEDVLDPQFAPSYLVGPCPGDPPCVFVDMTPDMIKKFNAAIAGANCAAVAYAMSDALSADAVYISEGRPTDWNGNTGWGLWEDGTNSIIIWKYIFDPDSVNAYKDEEKPDNWTVTQQVAETFRHESTHKYFFDPAHGFQSRTYKYGDLNQGWHDECSMF